MYWTDFNTIKIQRADLDGLNIEDLVTNTDGLSGPSGIVLDVTNHKMYWAEGFGDTSKIRRADLNGANIEDLVTNTDGLNFPQNIALDVTNHKMYWTDEGSSKIQRADLNGTNVEDLVTSANGLDNPEGIVLDVSHRKMYWTEGIGDASKIRRADLDGLNIEDLVTSANGLISPVGIALDVAGRKMYWAEEGASNIRRADLDGTNIEDLVTNHGSVRSAGIALDMTNRKVYWTDTGASKIQRADLDGTNIEDLVTSNHGLVFPYGFALGLPQPTGPLNFDPSTIADQTFTVGTPVNLTLPSVTGGTAPYTYTLSPIPAGLHFDTTTQLLSGTPTTAIPATLATYTATDATGASASLNFTIEVIEDITGPGIDPLDVNGDGQVTVIDLAIVALFYGIQVPADISLPADVNADGVVNLLDLTAVAQGIDAAGGGLNQLPLWEAEAALLAAVEESAEIEAIAGAPGRAGMPGAATSLSIRLAAKNIAAALADVRQMPVGDVRLGKGVAVLEGLLHLLAEMVTIPDQTTLLPNYPNPFNPETWLPYHLSEAADVTLRIYSVDGKLVRKLTLGHQPAGIYQSRLRAAYWNGKNENGEPVASGLYFYTLTAGDFTATRKLLIVK